MEHNFSGKFVKGEKLEKIEIEVVKYYEQFP